MAKKFDQSSRLSILEYARKLVGKSLRTADNVTDIDFNVVIDTKQSSKTRGSLGMDLEKYYFGITPGNDSSPDFKEVGIELKSHPVKFTNKGYVAKERLVLGMIDYHKLIKENFRESKFFMKNRDILLMSYLHQKGINYLDFQFLLAEFLSYESFSDEDKKIILDDWTKIQKKVTEGRAHELSEGDTMYLGAVTKSSDATKRTSQPIGPDAKPRAFSYKNGFMTYKIRQFLGKEIEEDVLGFENGNTDFDNFIYEKISRHLGKSFNDIHREFGNGLDRNGKGVNRILIQRMLGSNKKTVPEFEKANVTLKVIRVTKNKRIKEAISFPSFEFKKIVAEDIWEKSSLYKSLESTRFLFVFFKEDTQGVFRLDSYLFWNMSLTDLEKAKLVWDKTKNIIKEGKIIKNINTNSLGGYSVINNFPGISESEVLHVRPHAKNRLDTFELPTRDKFFDKKLEYLELAGEFDFGNNFTKQCFWLNQGYVRNIYLSSKLSF